MILSLILEIVLHNPRVPSPSHLVCHIKSGYIGMIKKPLQAQQSAESEGEEGNLAFCE